MRRLGPVLFLLVLGRVASASAQAESASSLARPPIRGAEYVPPAAALPPPGSALPSPSDEPLPPPTSSLSPNLFGSGTLLAGPVAGTEDEFHRARMNLLDQHLSSLGARRTSNIGGGVVTLLMGGAYVGIGVYANRNGEPTFAKYFFISGGASIVSAGVGFALMTNPERAYTRFSAIRDDPSLSSHERLRLSESILESLARRRRATRFTQASIDLAVTAISLPFLLGNDGFDKSNAFDWLITISAVISTVDAVTTMVQRSEEERRYRMYRLYADAHGGDELTATAPPPRLRLAGYGLSPLPGGGIGGVSFIF